MKKIIKITIVILLLIAIASACYLFNLDSKSEIRTVKSDKELLKIYEGDYSSSKETVANIVSLPFSFLINGISNSRSALNSVNLDSLAGSTSGVALNQESSMLKGSASSKDYSTTNIQVENVDEADITKTDGDYIYSISNNKVIITNVENPEDIKIESTIAINSTTIPEDLILYNNKLVVIAANTSNSNRHSYSYDYYYSYSNTVVRIYDIEDKSKPTLVKSYELNEPYYTSRCINNQLYVIASGYMSKDTNKVLRTYTEDDKEKEIPFNNIHYLKNINSSRQTIISNVNLDDVKKDISIKSYLIDISNAYVSEHNIYLLDKNYEFNSNIPPLSHLFKAGGVIGFIKELVDSEYDYLNSGYYTDIYKFNIKDDGNITYDTKASVKGSTINQYSLDEKDGHLRVALDDNNGARIEILDENLKQIGVTENVGKGEKMYSSRFIGNKAYLVTYRNTDPLFVIDLSDESSPKVLGELHIPGYSTYLHPYDETHLIGIGMETEEVVNRDSSGKVISTTAKIIGMKMALFDVSDVNNPIQISQTLIGDRRTTSAILTNPKALLFSKEKELIAIPVNNYEEDFEVDSSSDTYESTINSYTNYNKKYVAEGYFVYKINVKDGFDLKGVITHEASNRNIYNSYYYNSSKLLRGLYIDNNLYTVSETAVKVNNLDSLDLISELKIK